jgi:hypothetical protein
VADSPGGNRVCQESIPQLLTTEPFPRSLTERAELVVEPDHLKEPGHRARASRLDAEGDLDLTHEGARRTQSKSERSLSDNSASPPKEKLAK